jgi:hypothetical protein
VFEADDVLGVHPLNVEIDGDDGVDMPEAEASLSAAALLGLLICLYRT